MSSEIISINLSDKEQESYIRAYITHNMLPEALEQYVDTLDMTDSLAEACKTAILNEHICRRIEANMKTMAGQ